MKNSPSHVLNECWPLSGPTGFALTMPKVFISFSSVILIAFSSGVGADEETEAQSWQVCCPQDGGGDASRREEPSGHLTRGDSEA